MSQVDINRLSRLERGLTVQLLLGLLFLRVQMYFVRLSSPFYDRQVFEFDFLFPKMK
jgi:hypothetical protein